jgi:hypothetical protein
VHADPSGLGGLTLSQAHLGEPDLVEDAADMPLVPVLAGAQEWTSPLAA